MNVSGPQFLSQFFYYMAMQSNYSETYFEKYTYVSIRKTDAFYSCIFYICIFFIFLWSRLYTDQWSLQSKVMLWDFFFSSKNPDVMATMQKTSE